MLKRLTMLGVVFAVTVTALPVTAQNVAPKKAVRADNAQLKRTIAGLQKKISTLSSRLKKIESVISVDNRSNVDIKSGGVLKITGYHAVLVKAPAVTVHGIRQTMIEGGVIMLGGKGGRPVARAGDNILATPTGAGKVIQGSPKVLAR